MSLFPLLALALLSTALPTAVRASEPSADLTRMGEIRKLAIRDYATGRTFDITGLVTSVGTSHCLIDTEDGGASLWIPRFSVQSGQIIRASGYTELNDFAQDPALIVTNLQVVGHGTVPSIRLLSYQDIQHGDGDHRIIRVRGFLTDVFEDEVDKDWLYGILNMEGRSFRIAFSSGNRTLARVKSLVDADVELTGECLPRGQGKRKFLGRNLLIGGEDDTVKILSPLPEDAFFVPPLESFDRIDPEYVHSLHRRKVSGCVLAAYAGHRVLLAEPCGRIVLLYLADGKDLPRPGTTVEAVGFPETDFYNINLSGVILREIPGSAATAVPTTAEPVSPQVILHNRVTGRIDTDYHGKTVRLRGIVRTTPDSSGASLRLGVECNKYLVPVDISAHPEFAGRLQIGSEIEVTGVCILEADNWNSNRIFPTIRGILIVIRAADDIRILSRPPWWTPQRFALAVGTLFVVLIVILIWNAALRKLVERRSRQLVRSQAEKLEADLRVDERTRIAAELHDYLAQNLTAVAYKLTSARATRENDPEAADAQLETAAAMLDSSRTELRRCLWDLKSKALEEPTFDLAIRRSLQQITDLKNVNLAFNVPRARISDPTAHAILSVIRELVANAVNHGLADRITVCGEIKNGFLRVIVTDNGSGFDVSHAETSDGGHFGLDGVRQRIKRLDGTFEIVSQSAKGTRAVILIPPHTVS